MDRRGERPQRADGDPSPVVEDLRERAEAVADREVDRALRELEARGDFGDGQRRDVRELADRIVTSLVVAPARTVETAARADDDVSPVRVDDGTSTDQSDTEHLRRVVSLLDPERE